jgi:hypothetical protein
MNIANISVSALGSYKQIQPMANVAKKTEPPANTGSSSASDVVTLSTTLKKAAVSLDTYRPTPRSVFQSVLDETLSEAERIRHYESLESQLWEAGTQVSTNSVYYEGIPFHANNCSFIFF